MATYNTPGVYVEEIATLPGSVAQVASAIPAFIGYTKNASPSVSRIESFSDYVNIYGGPFVSTSATSETLHFTVTGTTPATYSISDPSDPGVGLTYKMYYAVQMYFANGGGPCYIASAGAYASPTSTPLTNALNNIAKEDEPTLLVLVDGPSLTSDADYWTLVDKALQQCNTLGDRFTIIDTFADTSGANDIDDLRSGLGMNYLMYGAAYYPYLNTTLTYPDEAVLITYGGSTVKTLADMKLDTATTAEKDILNKFQDVINQGISDNRIVLPPSSAIAGVYASVDRDRGVWKAPANVSLTAVQSPVMKITDDDQGDMNVDPTAGKSVNAIRTFTGKGHLVWGARTLAGNNQEWRYVPVRRLFITVEESIAKATQFVVFEPNDANTWLRVKTMIENYLANLWRQGALAGPTPEAAFFVKVGLGETMTSDDILNGILNIEIGMAAVRPAEFIVLKFMHKLQES